MSFPAIFVFLAAASAAPAPTAAPAATPAATPAIDKEVAEAIVKEAETLRQATLAKDYAKLVSTMHPKAVAKLGGKEAAVKAAAEGMEQVAASGLKLAEYTVSPPTALYEATDEQLAFVPTSLVLRGDKGGIKTTGYLVASRPKAGGAWRFVDGSGFTDRSALEEIFPGLPKEAQPPEAKFEMLDQ